MKDQNKATTRIVETLDILGFNVDKVTFKTAGNPENDPYIEGYIKISSQGWSKTDQD